MQIDANSLMQYFFVLYAKYGKGSTEKTIDSTNNPQSKLSPHKNALNPKKVTQSTKNKSLKKQRQKVIKHNNEKHYTSETVKTNTSQGINKQDACLIDRIDTQKRDSVTDNTLRTKHGSKSVDHNNDGISSKSLQSSTDNRLPSIVNSKSSSSSTSEHHVKMSNIPPVFSRKLKLSINSKTGSLRISELHEDCGSLVDNRLTLPPEVDIWKLSGAIDLNQSILDISDIIRKDTAGNVDDANVDDANVDDANVGQTLLTFDKGVVDVDQNITGNTSAFNKAVITIDKNISAFDKTVIDADQNISAFDKAMINVDQNRSEFDKAIINVDQNRSEFDKAIINVDQNRSAFNKEIKNVDNISAFDKAIINVDQNRSEFDKAIINVDQNRSEFDKSVIDKRNACNGDSDEAVKEILPEYDRGKKAVVFDMPPVTSDWIQTDHSLDSSPCKESIALQRSRRKSKPQKFVSLDDNFTFSEDELNCNSFDLDDFDADWLDLDMDDIDAATVSPTRDKVITKSVSKAGKGKRIYQCVHCDVRMTRADRLERHVHSAHKQPTPLQCIECSRSFATQFRLDCHRLTCRFSNLPNKCEVCGLRYESEASLDSHNCSGDPRKPFRCDVCDYKTGVCKEIEQHRGIHNDEKKYACALCDFKTAWKKSLRMHVVKHDGSKPYGCTICDFTCNDKCNLSCHIKCHSVDLKETCDICGTQFRLKRHLNNHQRLHRGEKMHKCEECDYSSASLPNLISHRAVHRVRKKHACLQCDQTFSRPTLLKTHVLKLHGANRVPFACSFCDYVGTCRQGLNSHMKKHSKRKLENVEIRSSERQSAKLLRLSEVKSSCGNTDGCHSFHEQTTTEISDCCKGKERCCREDSNNGPINYTKYLKMNRSQGGLETFDYETEPHCDDMHATTRYDAGNRCGPLKYPCDGEPDGVPATRQSACTDTKSVGNDIHERCSIAHEIGRGVKLSHGETLDDRDPLEVGNDLGHDQNIGPNYKTGQHMNPGHSGDLGQGGGSSFDTARELQLLASGSCYANTSTDFVSSESLSLNDESLDSQLLMTFGGSRVDWGMGHSNSAQSETISAMLNVIREYSTSH